MRKHYLTIGAVLASMAITACSSNDDIQPQPNPDPVPGTQADKELELTRTDIVLSEKESEIALNQYAFPVELLTKTYLQSEDGNVTLSPLSASIALGMLTNGIDSNEREELLDVLNISNGELQAYNGYVGKLMASFPGIDPNATLLLNNGFWFTNEGEISADYGSLMENNYKSDIYRFDIFNQTVFDHVNSWTKENTKGLIPSILREEDKQNDFKEIWVNTLYFKGVWRQKFDKRETSSKPFYANYPETATSDNVEMMYGKEFRYSYYHLPEGMPYSEENLIRSLMLPFGNEAFVFTAVLPSEANPDIEYTLQQLTPKYWQAIDRIVAQPEDKGHLRAYLPKINLQKETDLIPVLENMGVGKIFSGVSMKENLGLKDLQRIGVIRQKVNFELDEEGSTVAAATVIGGEMMANPTDLNLFEFNRPFVYFIRERTTGAVLLAGVYSHP